MLKIPAFAAALLTCAAVLASAQSAGDGVVVHFKDGSHISGILVESTKDHVAVSLGSARAEWPADQIASVEKKRTALQRFQTLVKAAGQDAAKLKAAALFAKQHRLFTEHDALVAAHPKVFPQAAAPAAAAPASSAPRAGGACLVRDPQAESPGSGLPDAGQGYARTFLPGASDIETVRQSCALSFYQQLLDDYVAAGNKNPGVWEIALYNADGTLSQSRRVTPAREEREAREQLRGR